MRTALRRLDAQVFLRFQLILVATCAAMVMLAPGHTIAGAALACGVAACMATTGLAVRTNLDLGATTISATVISVVISTCGMMRSSYQIHVESGPISHLFYLTSPALPAIGLVVLLLRRQKSIALGACLDATMVALSIGLFAWVTVLRTAVSTPGLSTLGHDASVVYPLIDFGLIACVYQIGLTRGARSTAYRLIVAALALTTAADLKFPFAHGGRIHAHQWTLTAVYLLAYGLLATATAHPSMRRLVDMRRDETGEAGRDRHIIWMLAVLVPAGLTAIHHPADATVDRVVRVAGLAVLGILVCARLTIAVARHVQAEQRFAYQAKHDPLTGLPNRQLINAKLEAALVDGKSAAARLGVLALGLSGALTITDLFGESAANEVRLQFAARLRAATSAGDLLGRLSDNVFLVCRPAPCDEPAAFDAFIQQMSDLFSEPFHVCDLDIPLAVHFGLAYVDDEQAASDVVDDADMALSHASRTTAAGRAVVFDPQMRESGKTQLQIEQALRAAVGTAQIQAHYQPLVSLADGRLSGFEALARWEQPGVGMISPADFIPVAEASGLIVELGRQMLRTATAALSDWRRRGVVHPETTMSVNVSTLQLRIPGFVADVRQALADAGLPAAALVLEITESVMVNYDDTMASVLQELHDLGATLALDDFGTGYSALGYLHRIPVGELKIDQSFVAKMETPPNKAIVRAIVAMAKALNLTLVAEGIETPEQRDALAEMGCETGQGWLFGRPVPARQIEETVAALV